MREGSRNMLSSDFYPALIAALVIRFGARNPEQFLVLERLLHR